MIKKFLVMKKGRKVSNVIIEFVFEIYVSCLIIVWNFFELLQVVKIMKLNDVVKFKFLGYIRFVCILDMYNRMDKMEYVIFDGDILIYVGDFINFGL